MSGWGRPVLGRKRNRGAPPPPPPPGRTTFRRNRRMGGGFGADPPLRVSSAFRRPGPGYFAGRFRGRSSRPRVTNYERYGGVHSMQTFGSNTMTNVNYIGISSFVTRQLAIDVGCSFIRYVMKRHFHQEYSSVDEPLTPYFIGSATCAQSIALNREFNYVGSNGVHSRGEGVVGTFSFSATATVKDFGVWFADTIWNNAEFSTTHEAFNILKSYTLNGEQEGVLFDTNSYDIDTMKIRAFVTTTLKLQNSTPNDAGGNSTDVNNANPLKGKMFRFRGLNPRLRQDMDADAWSGLEWPDGYTWSTVDGVLYPTTNPAGVWRNVPTPTVFKNCRSHTSVYMNPGDIKTVTLRFKYYGTINDLLRGTRYTASTNAVPLDETKYRFGTMYLFALEQVVRTGATGIVINYQVDRTSGAYVLPPRRSLMKKWVERIEEVSNAPT